MNKKNIIIIIISFIVAIAGIIGISYLIKQKRIEDSKRTYVAYVKINPLTKVTFDIYYDECKKDYKECKKIFSKVTNIEYLNEDAKTISKRVEYEKKNLEQVIAAIIDAADIYNYDIGKVEITSDYDNIDAVFNDRILSYLKTSKGAMLIYTYQKEIDEDAFYEKKTTSIVTKTTSKSTSAKCVSKKFKKKYTYAYKTKEECKKQGNYDFNTITDTVDDTIFSYGCEAIKDDCGDTWYGVIFYKWSEEKGEYPYYY